MCASILRPTVANVVSVSHNGAAKVTSWPNLLETKRASRLVIRFGRREARRRVDEVHSARAQIQKCAIVPLARPVFRCDILWDP